MLVKDFSFDLPDELIARYPLAERDSSRLMVLDRQQQHLTEAAFHRIGDWLHPGDLLVVNNTRVIPARLFGHKTSGGRVEIFLVEHLQGADWRCMLRSSKTCKPGQRINLAGGVVAEVLERSGEQDWQIRFLGSNDFDGWLQQAGQMPIPPYLNREEEAVDRERYQTVYAAEAGAVAAPTAGLHFTSALLEQLRQSGVRTAEVTLHVGLGTFQPVRVERVQDHRIHRERYRISSDVAAAIAETKAQGKRVIAVGTTACRTLEYAASEDGRVQAGQGEADIFIYPGYRFRVVDGLITNFHLPESTLLMLVCAFGGQQFVLDAYQKAVAQGFRFYSYGDAMLLV